MENKIISKNELSEIIQKACEEGMLIQRTINDKYDIPATRIKKYSDLIIQKQFEDKKPDNFICQQCKTDKMCSKYCLNIEEKIKLSENND